MKHTSFIMGSIISFSIVGSSLQASEQTRVPYLEAQAVSYFPSLSRADIQRQLVLLSSQSRLTPSWPPIYREIAEISLNIGRGDLAERALRKFPRSRAGDSIWRINSNKPIFCRRSSVIFIVS